MEKPNWRFAVVGNIVHEHTDGETIYYGTKAFTGGTKVYIHFNREEPVTTTLYVFGLNRFNRYASEVVSLNLVENIRIQRVYKPNAIAFAEYEEWMEGCRWMGSKVEDRKAAQKFLRLLKKSNFGNHPEVAS